MNCPVCGRAIDEGKAYCSEPSCGAVIGQEPRKAPREIKIEKELKFNLTVDFTALVRAGALLLAAAAAAWLYFFASR